MYKVFLTGGIASGKSTVAHELERLGARCIDLDEVSREVTRAGSPMLDALAAEFGADIVDPETGSLRRGLLASRAFVSDEATHRLEEIEIPAIKADLVRKFESTSGDRQPVCVVEVQLLDRAEDLIPLVDEVLYVACPLPVRRARALGRGMDGVDFDRRVAHQPDEAYLSAHADTIFHNTGSRDGLTRQVEQWWDSRASQAWRRV